MLFLHVCIIIQYKLISFKCGTVRNKFVRVLERGADVQLLTPTIKVLLAIAVYYR